MRSYGRGVKAIELHLADIATASEVTADLRAGCVLLAGEGSDSNALRAAVARRDASANIPPRVNRKDPIYFSKFLYRQRNLFERLFNKIKRFPSQPATTSWRKVSSPQSS